MRQLLFGSLVLVATVVTSCAQSRPTPTSQQTEFGLHVLGPEDRGDITSFAVSPAFSTDQTLFAGVLTWDHGVLRSTDGGRTWQKVYGGLRGNSASWVVISPTFTSDKTLFAGKGNGGVFRSTNGGDSWKKASEGIFRFEDSGRFVLVDTLAISPFFDRDSTLFAGTSTQST